MNQHNPDNISPQSTDKLGTVKEEAKQEASQLKSNLSNEVSRTGEKIKQEAKGAMEHLQEAGRRYAMSQKDTLSEKVSECSQALGAAARRLEESGDSNPLAAPAESLARQLDKFSGYLKNAGTRDLLEELSHTARRRPELVFGSLFLAGLVGARFLKASGKPHHKGDTYRPFSGRDDDQYPASGSVGSGYQSPGYGQPAVSGYGQATAGYGREATAGYDPSRTNPGSAGASGSAAAPSYTAPAQI